MKENKQENDSMIQASACIPTSIAWKTQFRTMGHENLAHLRLTTQPKKQGRAASNSFTDVVAQVHTVPASCLLKSIQLERYSPVIMATVTTPSSYEEQWVPRSFKGRGSIIPGTACTSHGPRRGAGPVASPRSCNGALATHSWVVSVGG